MTHPSTAALLRWFEYEHLRNDYLKEVSKIFADTADRALAAVHEGPEVSAGLRHLLEAKDCFVRAGLLVLDEEEQERLATAPKE